MDKIIIMAILLFVMGIVYSVAFISFNVIKSNMSKENVNKKPARFWTILTFCLSYFCFIAGLLLLVLLK